MIEKTERERERERESERRKNGVWESGREIEVIAEGAIYTRVNGEEKREGRLGSSQFGYRCV